MRQGICNSFYSAAAKVIETCNLQHVRFAVSKDNRAPAPVPSWPSLMPGGPTLKDAHITHSSAVAAGVEVQLDGAQVATYRMNG